jgi:hypothetical protein
MNHLGVARAVYALLLTFGCFNWMRIYPKLPQRIAVHFGYDGTPNGWAPKEGFLWTILIVVAILSVTTIGMPRLVTAFSGDRMNLPHRAYWLASERWKQTMGFIEAGYETRTSRRITISIPKPCRPRSTFSSSWQWFGWIHFVRVRVADCSSVSPN